jgi:hypothetical protein
MSTGKMIYIARTTPPNKLFIMTSYTVAIIGNTGVGKTTFIKRWETGKYSPLHISTMGCSRSLITVCTTDGDVTLHLNDYAGKDIFSVPVARADAVIVMTDPTDTKFELTRHKTTAANLGARVVLKCCSKFDRAYKPGCDIYFSSKTGYNISEPFLRIIKELSENDEVRLCPSRLDRVAALSCKKHNLLDIMFGSFVVYKR